VSAPAGRVSAVVVNFEAGPLLTTCVASLATEADGGVVVVDNGSEDGSTALLTASDPSVPVLRPGRNLGFGGAVNRGVAATGSELVLVCNPDLEVLPGAVAALVAALDADPTAGVAGPVVRTGDGHVYPSARRFPSLVDAAGHALLGLWQPDNRFTRRYHGDTTATSPIAVDWVSGACFLARRAALESVGGFDEDYFMYVEDVDLCWRLARAGWATLFVPGAVVVHHQGVSTAAHPYRMLVAHHRSLLRFAWRSTSGWKRALLPVIAAGILARGVLAAVLRASGRGNRPSA
jgi:N-acetylglucosaminyl-diphospho-decaprenol L-rhamnosyltransferase